MRFISGPYNYKELENLDIIVENPNLEYNLLYIDNGTDKKLMYITPILLEELILVEGEEPYILIEKDQMGELVKNIYEINKELEGEYYEN